MFRKALLHVGMLAALCFAFNLVSLASSDSPAACLDIDQEGFQGPTDGSLRGIEVYYKYEGDQGHIHYIIRNRTRHDFTVSWVLGELAESETIRSGYCLDVFEHYGRELHVTDYQSPE
jgi:hypothetical protein